MHKDSTRGFSPCSLFYLFKMRVCTAVRGTQMALRSLPVTGQLLLSADIPSESTGVCFMQPDGIIITESSIS